MSNKLTYKQIFSPLVAFLLVLSFGLHAISVDHHHPWAGADGIQAALHGEDKKWLADMLCVLYIWTGLLATEFFYRTMIRRNIGISLEILVCGDPMRSALRKGIVHPKLCA